MEKCDIVIDKLDPAVGKHFTAKSNRHQIIYKIAGLSEDRRSFKIQWYSFESGIEELNELDESVSLVRNKLENGEYIIKDSQSMSELKVGDIVKIPTVGGFGQSIRVNDYYVEEKFSSNQWGLFKHGYLTLAEKSGLGEVVWSGICPDGKERAIVKYKDCEGVWVQIGFNPEKLTIVLREGGEKVENLITNKIEKNGTKGIEVFKVTATITAGKRIKGSGISGKGGIASIRVGHLSNQEIVGF